MAATPDNQTSKRPQRPVESIKRAPKTDGPAKATPTTVTAASTTGATGPTPQPKQAQNNTVKIIVIVLAVLIGLSIIGGLAATFLAKSIFEGGITAVTGNKAKLDTKSGTVTLEGEGGKSSVSTSKELPAGFPKDVPVYQPSTIKFSASLTKGSYNVTFSTNDNTADVVKYYEKELSNNGWQLKEDGQVSFGTVTTSTYTKGKSDLVVVVAGGSGDSSATSVSLSYRDDASK